MNLRLDGQRALVTGGNSGIGEGIAVGLADSGARVAINYVTHPEAADAVVAKIKAAGGDAVAIQADIADPAGVERMFGQLDGWCGGIDILVNNAGIDGSRRIAWEADVAAWKKVIDINLVGTFLCARLALQRMVPQKKGVIINLSSVHEQIAWSGYSAYASTKAAVGMLTKTLAQEAAPFGIRVVAIAPGAIRTPINQDVWKDPKSYADLLEKIPLNRIGETSDIAAMAVMLASSASSYVTGCTIYVDGGMTDYPDFAHGG